MLQKEKTIEANKALLEYLEKKKNEGEDKNNLLIGDEAESVYLQISTKKFVSDKKVLKPKKVAVPHSIYQDSEICIFTKDPQRNYKNALMAETAATHGMVSRIIGVSKLKGKFKSYESRRQLLSMYDIFLSEDSVVTTLPKLLGKVFYDGSVTKMPLPVRLTNDGKISDKKAQSEINKVISSAIFTISPGTTVSIKVGDTSFSPKQLQENIDAVIEYFTKTIPKGNWDNIRTVNVKSASSPSLPIYVAPKIYSEEDIKDEKAEQETEKKSKSEKRKRTTLTRLEKALAEVVDDDELERFTKKPVKQTTQDSN